MLFFGGTQHPLDHPTSKNIKRAYTGTTTESERPCLFVVGGVCFTVPLSWPRPILSALQTENFIEITDVSWSLGYCDACASGDRQPNLSPHLASHRSVAKCGELAVSRQRSHLPLAELGKKRHWVWSFCFIPQDRRKSRVSDWNKRSKLGEIGWVLGCFWGHCKSSKKSSEMNKISFTWTPPPPPSPRNEQKCALRTSTLRPLCIKNTIWSPKCDFFFENPYLPNEFRSFHWTSANFCDGPSAITFCSCLSIRRSRNIQANKNASDEKLYEIEKRLKWNWCTRVRPYKRPHVYVNFSSDTEKAMIQRPIAKRFL